MEILDLVDEKDNVIGQEDRNEALKKGRKNIRFINIFIYTSDNRIIVPLRSANRTIYPNCYDFSVGGAVKSGDTYLETAYKELEEELGITGVELEEIGYFNPCEVSVATFSKLYKLIYNEELNYDKDGISEIFYFTEGEIQDRLKETPEKFKGDYKYLFNYAINNRAFKK